MRQKLGQHFLKNSVAIQKSIAALRLAKDDIVLEIGPGRGALTTPLSQKCKAMGCQLIVVEKDADLAEALQAKHLPLEVHTGDILKLLPDLAETYGSSKKQHHFKIIGNIPYYITGKLLRTISELSHKPSKTVLMIQREVAERVSARAPKMNLLAAATQVWARPEILHLLKPSDFSPPPKVESAIISLDTHENLPSKKELGQYYSFIKVFFKQPRKTIRNNLVDGLSFESKIIEKHLEKVGLSGGERPQNVDVDKLLVLSRFFA